MAYNSNTTGQGRGFDRQRDEEQEKRNKKAMGNKTRQAAGSGTPGDMPSAPGSIGELMSPSTFGRTSPDSNPDEFNTNVERNKSFLNSPDTQAALLQFGVALMGSAGDGDIGSNLGQAMALAAGAPGRMRAKGREADIENRKLANDERRTDLTERGLDLEEQKLNKPESSTPTELMKLYNEANMLEASGDSAGAALIRARMYQVSQEYSLTSGTILVPPKGNAGITDGKNMPTIENIPFGKADLEAKAAEAKVNEARQREIEKGILVTNAADEIDKLLGESIAPDLQITSLGSLISYLPIGTDSRRVSGLLDVLKANFGFNELQALRDASLTGGALGPVSDTENRLLQSVQLSFDQAQRADTLQQGMRTVRFLFDPQSIEKRKELNRMISTKQITTEQGINKFNEMYRKAVMPEAAEGPKIDLTLPPPYLSEKLKELWVVATPEEKINMLSPEDKLRLP